MTTRTFLLCTLLLAALYFVLVGVSFDGILPVERPLAQLILFPLVALLMFRFRFLKTRVPLGVLTFACVGAGASLSYTFIFSQNERGGVVFAVLKGDELGKQSRIFRELIDSKGKHARLSVKDTSAKIESNASAKQFLKNRPRLAALVWGTARWMNVSFRSLQPAEIPTVKGVPAIAGLDQLKFVPSVPLTALSLQPADSSSAYLADLFEGLTYADRTNDPAASAREEIALAESAGRVARWTTVAHRALPFWLLGNRYLQNALSQGSMQQALLKCAIKSFHNARRMIRRNDNRELLAAVHNNLGVASYAQYAFTGRKVFRKEALKNFRLAVKALSEKNSLQIEAVSPVVAAENLIVVLTYKNFSKEKRVRKGKRVAPKAKSKKGPKKNKSQNRGKKGARKKHVK